MPAAPRHALLREMLPACLLGLTYYLLATPAAGLRNVPTLAAIAWPAPAVACGWLWHVAPRWWPLYLSLIGMAMILVGAQNQLPFSADIGFACLNVIEVVVCAWIGRRFVAPDGKLDSSERLIRFFLLLPCCAIGGISLLGATIATLTVQTDWWLEWRILLVGNGVAMLILVPLILSWRDPERVRSTLREPVRYLTHPATLSGCAAVLAIMLAGSLLQTSEEVLRAMLSLTLVAVAIYGGMPSATITVALAALLGIAMTLLAYGPYRQSGGEDIWRLQVDLSGMALLTFFVAIAARERRRLAVRLEQARRFESLGLLAGGIAHDFNNILGAVNGYTEMAEERLPPASAARAPLQEALAAAARGKDLTEQILLAARRGDRMRTTWDLRDATAEAVQLARPLCPPGIELECLLPGEALPVHAHRGQVTRAALNLIRNATQAARSHVQVTLVRGSAVLDALAIGDAPPAMAVWIEVSDDGAGIAAEHRPHLFDPFFSTRNGPGGGGTGLGLAIVAGVATEHDGCVSVATSAGGTRFRFILPLAPQEADGGQVSASGALSDGPSRAGSVDASVNASVNTSTAASTRIQPASAIPALGQGERVLLLDDDSTIRERSEEWLAELGFEPVGYGDAPQALAAALAAPDDFAVLLTDLDMPALQGDEIARQLRAVHPSLPVIFCSGSLRLEAAARAARAVALSKPFDRADLAQAIRTAMGEKR